MGLSGCVRRTVGEPSGRRRIVSIPERNYGGSMSLNQDGKTGVHHDERKGVTWSEPDGGK